MVTASIQWTQVSSAHWSVLASWYGALVLSLFSLIIALHLSILFATLEAYLPDIKPSFTHSGLRQPRRPLMLYALQSHILLLSYGIISYVIGLSVMLLRPLWTLEWGDESRVRVFQNVAILGASKRLIHRRRLQYHSSYTFASL